MRLNEERRQVRDLFWRNVLLETYRLIELNHRSFKALKGRTDEEVYRRMLVRYHQRGFVNVPNSRGRAEEFYQALISKSESDWEKDAKAISDLMAGYRNEIDGLFSQMRSHAIDVIKKQIVENTLPGSQTAKAHVEKMESYWSRYDAINTRTLQEFGEFASLSDSPRLRPMMEAGLRQRRDRKYQMTNVRFKTFDGKPSISSTQLHSDEAGDSWDRRFQWPEMTTPIRLDSVLRIAMGLELDRSMKSVVQLLHEDYKFRWKLVTAPMSELLREYREIYRLILAGEHKGGKSLSRQIDNRYGLYHELLKRYEELDGAFIDQFEAMSAKVHQPLFASWKQSRRVDLVRPALLDGTANGYTMTGLAVRTHHELVILRVQSQRTDLFLLMLEEIESDDWVNEETLSILSDYYRETTATYRDIHAVVSR